MLGTSLLKLTERRAPLKPKRKERKKVTAQNIKGDEVKIVINITRAQNIPVRTSSSLAYVSKFMVILSYQLTLSQGLPNQEMKAFENIVGSQHFIFSHNVFCPLKEIFII